jgi:hypothetical protein
MKRVSEIASHFGVSDQAVRKWLKDGLKFDVIKDVGYKSYVVVDPNDVLLYQEGKRLARVNKKGE